MHHLAPLRSLIATLTLLALSCPAGAQTLEERPELSSAVARKLIAQFLEVVESQVDVAYVLNGEKSMKRGFTSRDASVAVYLATRIEEGQRRRRCEEQVFLWNPQFGWFLEEVVEERARDYLRIFSERQGFLEIK